MRVHLPLVLRSIYVASFKAVMLLFCTSSGNLLDPAVELIARGEMCKRVLGRRLSAENCQLQMEAGDEVNWSKSDTASEDYQN